MLQPKTVVGGRYEIIKKIAEGGMGSVHEAVHLLSRRVVALKLLAPEVARDETKRQRFLREVSAPAQIGHDGIVEIFDAGYDEKVGLLFVAMELLQGETLRERIARIDPKQNPAGREQLLDLYDHMLEPLAAAHARGIVHRDLKPENVFVHRRRDGAEVVKILDFGIARELDTSTPSVTQTGIAMGTPHYMAPEQAMNAREASFPADVWSLGAMLYEILSGETPFPGEAAGSIIAAAVTSAHRPVMTVAPGIPQVLSDLIDRCLQKRPEDRPRDAQVLLDELRRARGRAASQVSPLSGSMTPPSSPSSVGPMTGPMTGHMSPAPMAPGRSAASYAATGAMSVTPMPPTAAMVTPTGPALDLARNVATPPTIAGVGAIGTPPAGSYPTPGPSVAPSVAASSSATPWLMIAGGAIVTLFGGGFCCLAGIFGLGMAGSAGGGDTDVATLGSAPIQWSGSLGPNDRREGTRYYDTYAFDVGPGERFTVELMSGYFDTIVRVGTPSGQSLENDDFPGMALNSRIDVPSSEGGRYTVHVTSYADSATGEYTVSVHH
ncbi:MAG: protein kinase [Deltaproteobacteria bacterium]|nr:protein kinase [Deltaproteobacteria bacterium]